MCVSPVKILNPSLNWHEGMPKYLVVECGRCFECRARRQQEWFVRAYYEYKNNMNGSNFFATLTFNNENLPVYEDKRDYQLKKHGLHVVRIPSSVNYSFQCFNNDYITTFMKLFRQNCKRMFPKVDTTKIKYFIVPEYGEVTHRSHYHVDIFCPFKLKVSDFQKIITKSWTHGFVGASKNGGFKIKSISSLEYTAKYSCKDLYFHDEVMSDYLDKSNLDEAEYNYRYERVKNFLPKVRVSNNFGSSLCQEIKVKDDSVGFLLTPRPLQVPKKNGELRQFAIPRYIVQKLVKRVDKLFSNCLERPYFVLTDLGKEYKKRLLLDKISNDCLEIRQLFSPTYLNFLRGKNGFENTLIDNFHRNVNNFINRLSIEKIAFYRNVLRYLPLGEWGKHSSDWYFNRKGFILNHLFKSVFPVELVTGFDVYARKLGYSLHDVGLRLSDIFPNCNGRSLLEQDKDNITTLSQLGEFQNYERISALIDNFYLFMLHKGARRREKDKKRIDFVRSSMVDFCLYSNAGLVRQIV